MITALLCTSSCLPLLRLSLPLVVSAGLSPVVYSCGTLVQDESRALGATTVLLSDACGGTYGSPAFSGFVSTKFDVLLDVLRSDDVFFLDLDVLVLADPRPRIRKSAADIVAQDDWSEPVAFRGPQVCSGCLYLRSSTAVVDLLLRAKSILASGRCACDETALNCALAGSPVSVDYVDRSAWQTGPRWHASDKTGRPDVLHFNGPNYPTVERKAEVMCAILDLCLTGRLPI